MTLHRHLAGIKDFRRKSGRRFELADFLEMVVLAGMSVFLVSIVLADSSKFGKKSFAKICGIEKVDQIITDAGVSTSIVKKLEESGIVVNIVS